MNPIRLYQAHRQRKHAREFLRHVVHVRRMREDLLPAEDTAQCCTLEGSLRNAIKSRVVPNIEQARKQLHEFASTLFREPKHASIRENLEIIAVAVAVAMAARTYFIQPFKIPTGSMQPTLYGIINKPVKAPGLTDTLPLRPVKWIVTGKWYSEIRAISSGAIHYADMSVPADVNGQRIEFPPARMARIPIEGQDFVVQGPNPARGALSYPVSAKIVFFISGDRYDVAAANYVQLPAEGSYVEKGTVLWRGHKIAGDHVFVDKVRWNFQHPKRGQIMVFKTDGMHELEKDFTTDKHGNPISTHYIKRLIGLPNEVLNIASPNVEINGQPLSSPDTITRIVNTEPPYVTPYEIAGEYSRNFPLGEGQYYAMGDNTVNSKDSRYWGHVPEQNMVGPACMVYWPFSGRWGLKR